MNVVVSDAQGEVLGHLVATEHGAGGKPDLIGAGSGLRLRVDCRDALRRSVSVAASSSWRLRARSAASRGLRQTTKPLIGELRKGDLGEIAFIEQGELERALIKQRPDARCAQAR